MAKDKYHDIVIEALEKDGWTITHDPYRLEIENFKTLQIDLGAEKLIGAKKENEIIAVEIKTFPSLSQITDFYKALGQFNFYEVVLKEKEPNRILFLAIPLMVKKTFYKYQAVQDVLKSYNVRTIVFDKNKKKIVEWIK